MASILFNAAEYWLKNQKVTDMRGPMSPSSNAEFGFLAEGFDKQPALMMPYNSPFYILLAKKYGLKKVKELLVYKIPASLQIPKRSSGLRILERLNNNPHISIR